MANSIDFKEPIQLLFKPDNRMIVKFEKGLQGKATFSNDSQLLKGAMEEMGIKIPLEQRGSYPELKDRRASVYLHDPSFGRAFYEVYFKHNMDPTQFTWQKIA